MARNLARVGRRRRVLNEEFLSASNLPARTNSAIQDVEPGDTPRYGAGANIENHPQVTSFVPRRLRSLTLIGLTVVAIATLAEVSAYFAEPISNALKGTSPTEVKTIFADRLVAWTSSALLLVNACYLGLIYSLRKHRLDDTRGQYRMWRLASWFAIGLSLNSVLGAQSVVAGSLGSLVNYQLLPGHAGWWLIPASLAGGWLLARLIVDAAECRTALSCYLLGTTCLLVSGIHSAGWSPAWNEHFPELLSRSLPLLGYGCLLVGSLLFARYVILDVQGLIEHSPLSSEAQAEISQEEEATIPMTLSASHEDSNQGSAASESAWVDGSEPEYDNDDFDNPRLSKADRKRLRKEKHRHRAA